MQRLFRARARGVLMGEVYGFFGMGPSLVFGAMKIVDVAHSDSERFMP
jgi:branched-subunit amino acid ABC-type transport system permease component